MSSHTDHSPEALHLDNGGLVLTAPFLPHFFQRLDMLIPSGNGRLVFRDGSAAERGVHLLQYLVDERTSAPEPELPLNKLLCGLPVAASITRGIEIEEHERRLCESLLQAMIANWAVIGSSSIASLRETFLRRDARLLHGEERWHLQVRRKTIDVLVDQIPWSFSVLLLPWMQEPLHVTW